MSSSMAAWILSSVIAWRAYLAFVASDRGASNLWNRLFTSSWSLFRILTGSVFVAVAMDGPQTVGWVSGCGQTVACDQTTATRNCFHFRDDADATVVRLKRSETNDRSATRPANASRRAAPSGWRRIEDGGTARNGVRAQAGSHQRARN